MSSPYMFREPEHAAVTCTVGMAGGERCRDEKCGRRCSTLLNGYCLDCTSRRNVNPARGFMPPIRLNDDAAGA